VLVARALVQDAPVMLLDEPFTGIGQRQRRAARGLLVRLADEGRALLVATHDVEQARRWDRVLCLNGRQIAYGPPDETLSLEVLEATYGADLVTVHHDPSARAGRPLVLHVLAEPWSEPIMRGRLPRSSCSASPAGRSAAG
jgi:ABC-type Mn2+/Zn2+ transport system ATPase subunit